jgi:hypothetical protein
MSVPGNPFVFKVPKCGIADRWREVQGFVVRIQSKPLASVAGFIWEIEIEICCLTQPLAGFERTRDWRFLVDIDAHSIKSRNEEVSLLRPL